MRNISLRCPECKSDHCVGDPSEALLGAAGAWFCFSCHSKGNYMISFQTKADGEEVGLAGGG